MDKADLIRINKMRLGFLLKSLRLASGVTQRDAARQAGYAKATFVCNVEKGIASLPIDKVLIFAEVYGGDKKQNLALAIVRLIHPDVWDLSSTIFAKGYHSKMKPEKLTKKIDSWIKQEMKSRDILI